MRLESTHELVDLVDDVLRLLMARALIVIGAEDCEPGITKAYAVLIEERIGRALPVGRLDEHERDAGADHSVVIDRRLVSTHVDAVESWHWRGRERRRRCSRA